MKNTQLVYAVVDGMPIRGNYWIDDHGTVNVVCEHGDAMACPVGCTADDVAHTLLVALVAGGGRAEGTPARSAR